MKRTFIGKALLLCFFSLLHVYAASPASASHISGSQDFSGLLEFIETKDRAEPLYVFEETEQFDRGVHQEFIGFFNQDKGMLNRIRADLGCKQPKWRVEKFKKRLVFVPESHKEYADLYESYCRAVIDFILSETHFDNPYAAIITLRESRPRIDTGSGITVFIVHNLAEEWAGTYRFSDENDTRGKSVTLKSTDFIGEIGSYSSMLEIKDNGTIEFAPNAYTIWQDSSETPYNTLIVPIEETFHILLRPFTQKAIQTSLSDAPEIDMKTTRKMVAQWMQVEEAIVGGLVDVFFRRIVDDFFPDFDLSQIASVLEEKSRTSAYKYLKNGIRTIEDMGVDVALAVYRRNPEDFRILLNEAPADPT